MRFPFFRLAHVAIDTILILAVYTAVFFLRFEGQIPKNEIAYFWFFLPVIPAIRLVSNYVMGIYSHLWKYVGLRELFSIFKSITMGSLIFVLFVYLTNHSGFPRSIFVFEWAFSFLAIGGVRFSRRFSSEVTFLKKGKTRSRTLIVGAGSAGVMVAAEMLKFREKGFIPVGFIDDDPNKWKARIHGLKVFGGQERLAKVVEDWEIDSVVVAMPSVSRKVIGQIVELCAATRVQLKIVPATHQILSGEVDINQLRSVQIEDLLGREPVVIQDRELRPFLQNQRIVITGAGGSIGSELCRQLVRYEPEVIYLIGHGENSIYRLHKEMALSGLQGIIPIVADIRHEKHINSLFQRIQPTSVFHAAAHKHVPLMEKHIYEAFLNNVLGTSTIAQAAQAIQCRNFTLISTDKATEPRSVMGMTKYFAELLVQRIGRENPGSIYSIVRFGNVIGSRGSVIPLFQEQITRGGPVTVTDEQMTRYFMTIPEAVLLVLQSALLAQGQDIFILNMGEPVNILELARRMIQLSGFSLEDIEIKISGCRPGEKLHEQLVWQDEQLVGTHCSKILKAIPNAIRLQAHLCLLDDLLLLLTNGDEAAFLGLFKEQLYPLFYSETSAVTREILTEI